MLSKSGWVRFVEQIWVRFFERQGFSFRFEQGRPYVDSARRKCLHIYYYFMDRELGLIHVMVQT